MSIEAPAAGGLEVWRGEVAAWQCDEMGHLNVRFYVAIAMEALAGAAAALGMPYAFTPQATATLIVREHHIRFLREARVAAPLHMSFGVLEFGEMDAVLLQTLFHSLTGQTCATFVTRVSHAGVRDCRAFSWPERSRGLAEALHTTLPREAGPRSIPDAPALPPIGRARALEAGVPIVGMGAVRAEDCDAFGRLRTELVMARLSDGLGHFIEPFRTAGRSAAAGARLGGAALEYRLVYFGSPGAGDPLELRSAFAEINPRFGRTVHHLLDGRTGATWAMAEHIGANFDLDARRLVMLSADQAAELQAHVHPGWGIHA